MIVNKFNSAILGVVPQYQEPAPPPFAHTTTAVERFGEREHQHRLVMLQPSTHQQWCFTQYNI